MIKLKSLGKKGLIISILGIASIGCISFYSYDKVHSEKVTTVVSNSYDAEAKKPEWITKKSGLIIIGEVTSKGKSVKVSADTKDGNDTVYTDTNIKIAKILKNKADKNIKEGDTVVVRMLGGIVDNLTVTTDANNLIPNDGKVLLYLSDISNYPTIPSTPGKKLYSIVGGIHGEFNISQTTDSGKKVDLKALTENTNEDFTVKEV